ncbi:hypothetical protein H0H92_003223 [Tricholoma furcatifolium]|nr:hypothetical protein H0H92_003223 [Tricholoma furcatifolium]
MSTSNPPSEPPHLSSSGMETTSSEYYQTSSSSAASDVTAWPSAGPDSTVCAREVSDTNPLSSIYAGKRSVRPIPDHRPPVLMQSYRIVDDHRSMNIPTLDEHITADLRAHTVQLNSSHLTTLFAKAYSSSPVAHDIITAAPDLFPGGGLFHIGLLTEIGTAAYLNDIVKCAIIYARESVTPVILKPLRYWSAERHDHLLRAGPWKCKPDVSLLPLVDDKPIMGSAVTWADITAVVEVTSVPGHSGTIRKTSKVKNFLMKYVQGDCVWAISMAMNATNFRVFLLDRQGLLEFGPLSYKDDAQLFVTIIIALVITPDLGRDGSFERRIPEKDDKQPLYTPSTTFAKRPQFVPQLKTEDPQDDDDSQNVAVPSSKKRRKSVTSRKSTAADVLGASQVILDCNLEVVTFQNVQYRVLQELFHSQTIVGRATRVWKIAAMPVNGQSECYIMKDSFVHCHRPVEAMFIRKLDCPQIPKLLGYDKGPSTVDTRPFDLAPEHRHYRERRRTVTSPICIRLPEVKSFVELISAFLDYAKAIRYLKMQNIMHRDISSANVMLAERPFSLEDFDDDKKYQIGQLPRDVINHLVAHKYRRGILIDYDYAAYINEDFETESQEKTPEPSDDHVNDRRDAESQLLSPTSTEAPTEPFAAHKLPVATSCRTGTPPFMAIPLLDEPQRHIVAFDLESLFYVLLFMVSYLSEPGTIQASGFADTPAAAEDDLGDSVMVWFKSKGSYGDLAHKKRSQLFTKWPSLIESSVSPYFTFLKPYMVRLWRALYPEGQMTDLTTGICLPEDCTDQFIEIFVEALTVGVRNEEHYARQWREYLVMLSLGIVP